MRSLGSAKKKARVLTLDAIIRVAEEQGLEVGRYRVLLPPPVEEVGVLATESSSVCCRGTPDEVCTLLHVKKSWLCDVVEAGTIEVVRLGKQLRFRRSALERYLEIRAAGGVAG